MESARHPLAAPVAGEGRLIVLVAEKSLDCSGALQWRDLLERVNETIWLYFEVVAPPEIHPESLGRRSRVPT